MKGIAIGTQPDHVGGGLIRSAGGWSIDAQSWPVPEER
jgi:hypothetical protein